MENEQNINPTMTPTDFNLFQETRDMFEETILMKVFRWGELKVGDCRQIEGTLVLRSDGSARFDCVTWTNSTHSGDYWWTAFRLTDNAGVTMHNEPYHRGPRMDDGNPPPRYRWGFDFAFDKNKYAQITTAIQFYRC